MRLGRLRLFLIIKLLVLSVYWAFIPLSPLHAAEPQNHRLTEFYNWLDHDMRDLAIEDGIDATLYDQVRQFIIKTVKLSDIPTLTNNPQDTKHSYQSEFSIPANYFKIDNLATLGAIGKKLYAQHAELLQQIEQHYGVPAPVILAIWGRESAYGRAALKHNVFSVLAIKAYASPRKAMFQQELLAALHIVQNGDIALADMKGSWAGALGQPQFMPTAYLRYAVDFDKNGHKDIGNSIPDTLASIANYLQKNGWQNTSPWWMEIDLPLHVSCQLEGTDHGRNLQQWQEMGIKLYNDASLPINNLDNPYYLILPMGRLGPAFLVNDNYYVLKSYNISDIYVLFIALLSNAITGGDTQFFTPWQPIESLSRGQIYDLQIELTQQFGLDVGNIDGLIGYKTRRAIGAWQIQHQRPETCYPDSNMVEILRP